MTQTDMILTDLRRGKRITPIDALRDYGCFRLGARIWDLRAQGLEIDCDMITIVNTKKKVACYYIKNVVVMP